MPPEMSDKWTIFNTWFCFLIIKILHTHYWKMKFHLKEKRFVSPIPVVQLVKNLPAMRESWVWSLCWEDPLEKGKSTHSSILAWRIQGYTVHGFAKSQTQLSDFHFIPQKWTLWMFLCVSLRLCFSPLSLSHKQVYLHLCWCHINVVL